MTSPSRERHALTAAIGRYRQRWPEKRQAHIAVTRAVASGVLPDPKTLACADCRGVAREYDHADYSRRLDVQAVCRPCHVKRGVARGSFEKKVARPFVAFSAFRSDGR